MEKRKAHYPLPMVKELLREGRVWFTKTALAGGASMGLSAEEMLAVVSGLRPRDLYKSMTSHADHTVWHDVYHAHSEHAIVYLKLTVIAQLLIISFKEKDA